MFHPHTPVTMVEKLSVLHFSQSGDGKTRYDDTFVLKSFIQLGHFNYGREVSDEVRFFFFLCKSYFSLLEKYCSSCGGIIVRTLQCFGSYSVAALVNDCNSLCTRKLELLMTAI